MSIHDDASGARLVTYVVDETIQCGQPGFATRVRRRVRVVDVTKHNDCKFCRLVTLEVLGNNDEILYKQSIELENFGDIRVVNGARESGVPIDMTLAGFAESIDVYADVAAWGVAHPSAGKTLKPGWVAHVGTMPNMRRDKAAEFSPTSHVWIIGEVRACETLLNETTRHGYVRARIEAYESELDVLIPERECPGDLRAGCIVRATCYVTGRVTTDQSLEWITTRSRPGAGVVFHSTREDYDRLTASAKDPGA